MQKSQVGMAKNIGRSVSDYVMTMNLTGVADISVELPLTRRK